MEVAISDFEEVDLMGVKSLQTLRDLEAEGVDASTFGDLIFLTFTTTAIDGTEVELIPNGANADVT